VRGESPFLSPLLAACYTNTHYLYTIIYYLQKKLVVDTSATIFIIIIIINIFV